MAIKNFIQLGQAHFLQQMLFSNMYGPGDHFYAERSHACRTIIKKICDAKINNLNTVEIQVLENQFENGYVEDGAKSLIKSINISDGHHLFNVGVEKEYQ